MRPLTFAAAMFLAACQPIPELDAACFDQPAQLEIGGGAHAFEPLHEGDALEVYLGPQGGYHLYYAIRATAVGAEVWADVTVRDLHTDRNLTQSSERLVLETGPSACTLEASGLLAVLDITGADAVAGHDVSLHLTVSDEDGPVSTTARARLEVAQ